MLSEGQLRVLQVATSDTGGGAQRVAQNLFSVYREMGHQSQLAVGRKHTLDPNVFELSYKPRKLSLRGALGAWERILTPQVGQVPGIGKLRGLCRDMQRGWRTPFDRLLGHEDFNFPGSHRLLQLMYGKDILHCHNLHGGYFNLGILPKLASKLPVVLTLHDAWLLSGHCAHSFDCMRWKTGCGDCPDLTIYPSITRDATAYNWRRKREIFGRSRVYVATPCYWLMRRMEASILAPSVTEARVVPNGIDLEVFRPIACRDAARRRLGIDDSCKVVIFAAEAIRHSVFKDYATFRAAIAKLSAQWSGPPLLFLALGDDSPSEMIEGARLKFVPFTHNISEVALYFAVADVCVHAARAETSPLTIIESLACGVPVIASAVGGIPELIEHETTGFLVTPGDANEIAVRLELLLSDDTLCKKMGAAAARFARQRFDVREQAKAYLTWYQEILNSWDACR
jgi:glycosyltransferase involved in cell wall biosynthesis